MKVKIVLPFLAVLMAVSVAWATQSVARNSDLVWFEVNAAGDAISPTQGFRGEQSPFVCNDGATNCARALSISQGEVSLNSGSAAVYHINSGVDIQTDYDAFEMKP